MSADATFGQSRSIGRGRLARVIAVQDDLVRIALDANADRIVKNEMALISPSYTGEGLQLKAEVLRVRGREADAQVYESTQGVSIGDPVTLTGALLSATLGPGLLGQVYDGLQNPLELLAGEHGVFLPRGVTAPALPNEVTWSFHPTVSADATIYGGDVLGWVEEGRFHHKIMAPFDLSGAGRLLWIERASFTTQDVIGEVVDEGGRRRQLRLAQHWPVRRSLAAWQGRNRRSSRLYPDRPLVTTQRIIDSFFPVARGGTACIPGPFGAGKTVLQNLIARFSDADVVVVVACGERAGEVVEMMTEFERLRDPRSGGALMERTVVVCNTSAMPVAAREASVHMGATLAEYYREMGLDVLLLADSTSRWAQALRETSGRLEEIPGEEAFPAYLPSEIKAFYERAGAIKRADGVSGSLTIIGTVSPAGGNFDEPVTQATLSTVKCFLGLSSERAYQRRYPAIDPLQSWSRYREQVGQVMAGKAGDDWGMRIQKALDLLHAGRAIEDMMKVAGEEGVSIEDAIVYRKAQFLDDVYLQQNAFDDVDASNSLDEQVQAFTRIEACLNARLMFADRESVRVFFAKITAAAKVINVAPPEGPEREALIAAYRDILAEVCVSS